MSFFWITLLLIFLIVFAVDWNHFRQLFGPKWSWWNAEPIPQYKTEFEIRSEYRRQSGKYIPRTRHDMEIPERDIHLENLIYDAEFGAAIKHVMAELEKARRNRDFDRITSYTIYRQRITRRQAEAENRRVAEIRNIETNLRKIRKLQKSPPVIENPVETEEVSPEMPEEPREKIRVDYLEHKFRGIRLYPPGYKPDSGLVEKDTEKDSRNENGVNDELIDL